MFADLLAYAASTAAGAGVRPRPVVPLQTELKLHLMLTRLCLVMVFYLGMSADGSFLMIHTLSNQEA